MSDVKVLKVLKVKTVGENVRVTFSDGKVTNLKVVTPASIDQVLDLAERRVLALRYIKSSFNAGA